MPTDFKGIPTTRDREYWAGNMSYINEKLKEGEVPIEQRAAILGSIIEESGGNPKAIDPSGAYQGLLQWGADRYRPKSSDPRTELNNQTQYILDTMDNTSDGVSWTHGGKGSGYNTQKETHDAFHSEDNTFADKFRAFSYGYVRPKGKEDSYNNRLKVGRKVLNRLVVDEKLARPKPKELPLQEFGKDSFTPKFKFADGGDLDNAWNNLSMKDKAEMMKVAIANGITSLPEIRQAYNEFADGGRKDSYIDADDRRHKVLLETREGNLYDSNGNNYTQSYLDENNVPVIMGTMPRTTVHLNGNPIEELREMGRGYIDSWVDRNILEPNNYDTKKIGEKLFYGLDPTGYDSPNERIQNAMNGQKRPILGDNLRNPVYAKYLGLDSYVLSNGKHSNVKDNLFVSQFKPQQGDKDATYYTSPSELMLKGNPLSDENLAMALAARNHYNKDSFVSPTYDEVMGNFTYSFGQDEKGKYLSYYDKWDLNPFKGSLYDDIDIAEKYGIGHPVELYNRRYYDQSDEDFVKKKYRKYWDDFTGNTEYRNISNNTFLNNPFYFEANTNYAYGGSLFANGGYVPSARLQKDIATWEGSEMKRNAPFSEVTKQFNATIPAAVRAKLSTNQLDALYSYGYNVGMGNLKKRVLPTLNNFVQGKATNEDVQRSMWASKDNVLRGLTRRRNWERAMFGGNYRSQFTGTGLGTHIDPTLFQVPQESFDNINSMINDVSIPQLQLPDIMSVDPSTMYKPPVIDDTLFVKPNNSVQEIPAYNPQQDMLEGLRNFNTVMGMFGQDTPFSMLGSNDSPSLLSYVNQIYNT